MVKRWTDWQSIQVLWNKDCIYIVENLENPPYHGVQFLEKIKIFGPAAKSYCKTFIVIFRKTFFFVLSPPPPFIDILPAPLCLFFNFRFYTPPPPFISTCPLFKYFQCPPCLSPPPHPPDTIRYRRVYTQTHNSCWCAIESCRVTFWTQLVSFPDLKYCHYHFIVSNQYFAFSFDARISRTIIN